MNYTILFFFLISFARSSFTINEEQKRNPEKPNIIVIFTDDQGYEDLGSYGSSKIKTPTLDRLADNGIRFTNFYVTSSVCSASRASLLTGKYSFKNGVGGVFFPDQKGMASSEMTIAEVLKPQGYKTACFGKWHLGDFEESLPLNQGFDTYYGIPYSNDMYIGSSHRFSKAAILREGYTLHRAKEDQDYVKNHDRNQIKERGIKELVPLFQNNEIIEYPCNQATLTQRYFEKAINFIDESGDNPFFLYLTPAMPHVPLFTSQKFKGTSERGLYGDVIEEIDFYVGELMAHLKAKNLDQNTLIIFASDNGPWLGYKELAGSAGQLRDGKFSNYEGGVRVPCIMYWPDKIKPSKPIEDIVSTLDFLPTIAHNAKAKIPLEKLDGINISPLLEYNEGLNRDYMLYTKGKEIYGIRKGYWKYLPYGGDRFADTTSQPQLFNLKDDIFENENLHDSNPEIVKQLSEELKAFGK